MPALILNVGNAVGQRQSRTQALSAAGCQVVESTAGPGWLSVARAQPIDLLVLETGGSLDDDLEACRVLRADPAFASTPLVLISNSVCDRASRLETMQAGANACLSPAADPDELAAQAQSLLRLRAAAAEAMESNRALRESEARYRRLFTHMAEGFFVAEIVCDEAGRPVDYRYLDANPAFLGLTGIDPDQAIGKTLKELLPGAEDVWIETFGRVALTGVPTMVEHFAAPLGRYYSTIAYSPRRGQFACLFRDVTHRRQAEEELRSREERLRLAQETGAIGIYDWDLSTGEVVWSSELERMYGIASPADPRQRREAWLACLHPDDKDRLARETSEWLESNDTEREWDYRVLRPDGGQRWIIGRSRVMRDATGRPLRVIGTNIDITERKTLEQRAEAQRAQLEAVYQAMTDGATVYAMDGTMVMVNRTALGLCGVERLDDTESRADVAPSSWELRYLDGTPLPIEEWPVSRVLRGESFQDLELEVRRPHTGQRWVLSYSGRPIRNEQGLQILGLIVNRDITEQKQAEAALRASEETARRRAEELERLMDMVPAAIWVTRDSNCDVITGNVTANRFYESQAGANVSAGPAGGGQQDVTRRFFEDGVELPPEGLPMQLAARTGQEVRDAQLDVLLPSGRWMTMLGGATPLFDTAGQVRGSIAAFIDITERRRQDERLREALAVAERREAEISAIYDSAPIGLCIFDREGRYCRINKRLAEINGLTPEEHRGRTYREIVPAIADQVDALLRGVLDTGEPALNVEIEGELPSAPGVTRTYIENWHPIFDAEGRVVLVNVAVHEITRLKQVERELRQANQIKDDFLGTLSHELRTPLTAILGWAHLLQRGGLDANSYRQAVDAINRNAHAQKQLIADVLDVSRMISGKLRLDPRPVDLIEITRLAVASVRPALAAKRVALELHTEGDEATVFGDPDRLQQVIWNLLSNATKFTGAGGTVSVRTRRLEQEVELSVADTGIGIRPDFLPHVFDRFAQADASMSRRNSGLGLGLSIVRQLVELHGGTVAADSEGEGRGAIFTVRLPARLVPQSAVEAEAEDDPSRRGLRRVDGLRVLVLDDVEDTRHLVSMVVQAAGGLVTEAGSAGAALALIALSPPDVVLADLGMPEMDGFEFLQRLRTLPEGGAARLPVVALTAYGSVADRERALAAGFTAHLAKPMSPDDLLDTLAAVAARKVQH